MASFTDKSGQQWQFAITHGDAMRVLKETGIRLYGLLEKKLKGLHELLADPEKFVSVIYALVEPDAEKRQVSPEAFGQAIDGTTLDAMAECFLENLSDFFPNAEARKTLRQMIKKGKELETALTKRVEAELEKIDQTPADQMLDLILKRRTDGPP